MKGGYFWLRFQEYCLRTLNRNSGVMRQAKISHACLHGEGLLYSGRTLDYSDGIFRVLPEYPHHLSHNRYSLSPMLYISK